jgi:hypothetical protein
VSKGTRQVTDQIEEKSALHDGLPEPQSRDGDGSEEQARPASLLDMLFREAEVIARNLKDSGARR